MEGAPCQALCMYEGKRVDRINALRASYLVEVLARKLKDL